MVSQESRLLLAQMASDFGDQVTKGLLALIILDLTKSTIKAGGVEFFTPLGVLIFTFFGGYFGDKLNLRRTLVGTDLIRGLLVIGLGFAYSSNNLILVYFFAILLTIFKAFFTPAKYSAWAHVIPNSKLEKYNGYSEASIHSAAVLGPLIAAFLVTQKFQFFGFIFDSITFFISALFYLSIKNINSDLKKKEISSESVFKKLTIGFRLIAKDRGLINYISYDSIQMFGFGAFNATLFILFQRDYGWSKGEYATYLSCVAIGSLIGGLLGITPLVRGFSRRSRLLLSAFGPAIFLFSMLFTKSFITSCILYPLADCFSVMTISITKSQVQIICKARFMASITSIFAARTILIKFGTVCGIGLCLFLSSFVELNKLLYFFCIPHLLSAFLFMKKEKIVQTSDGLREKNSEIVFPEAIPSQLRSSELKKDINQYLNN